MLCVAFGRKRRKKKLEEPIDGYFRSKKARGEEKVTKIEGKRKVWKGLEALFKLKKPKKTKGED